MAPLDPPVSRSLMSLAPFLARNLRGVDISSTMWRSEDCGAQSCGNNQFFCLISFVRLQPLVVWTYPVLVYHRKWRIGEHLVTYTLFGTLLVEFQDLAL